MQTVKQSVTTMHEDLFDRVTEIPMATPQSSVVEVSVVSPFYNEENILEEAITILLEKMDNLDTTWELIVVNDGSTDNSGEIVAKLADKYPRLRLVSYPINRGRGYALRQGIDRAQGDIIITTEIDLSWGEDIVERLYREIKKHSAADVVVASPHLPGGGYKNVPWKRVFFSQFGNKIIRTCMTNAVTMNTGMTRAYRREVIQSLPLEEDRKEFHLEVIMKAQALKYRLHEIPCLLEWKDYKHEGKRVSRKSSSKVNKLVISHTLFSLFANPIRYVWGLSGLVMLLSAGFLGWSVIRLLFGLVSVFTLSISLLLAILAVMLFTFGIIAQQGYMIQREIWTLKQSMLHSRAQLIEEQMRLGE